MRKLNVGSSRTTLASTFNVWAYCGWSLSQRKWVEYAYAYTQTVSAIRGEIELKRKVMCCRQKSLCGSNGRGSLAITSGREYGCSYRCLQMITSKPRSMASASSTVRDPYAAPDDSRKVDLKCTKTLGVGPIVSPNFEKIWVATSESEMSNNGLKSC